MSGQTHPLGWELRLLVGDELIQSQVCRRQEEVLDTADKSEAAMAEKGWV